VYDRSQQRWSIYWLNNHNGGTDAASGALLPPVVGGFKNGIGIFEGSDHIAGQHVLVRYIWSGVTTRQPRWEQEFSNDQGKTWETNWIMQFSPL